MSSNPDQQTKSPERQVEVLPQAPRPLRAAPRRELPPDGRVETQLRARVAELEAQLIEVARCLHAAEARAVALRGEADQAWELVTSMADSKSWRYTSALRAFAARVRGLL